MRLLLAALLLAALPALADTPTKTSGDPSKRRVMIMEAQNDYSDATYPGVIPSAVAMHQQLRNNTGNNWQVDYAVCTVGVDVTTAGALWGGGAGDTLLRLAVRLGHDDPATNCAMVLVDTQPPAVNTTYTASVDCDDTEDAGCGCIVAPGEMIMLNPAWTKDALSGGGRETEVDRLDCAAHYTILD